jgi:hypothetical protein
VGEGSATEDSGVEFTSDAGLISGCWITGLAARRVRVFALEDAEAGADCVRGLVLVFCAGASVIVKADTIIRMKSVLQISIGITAAD